MAARSRYLRFRGDDHGEARKALRDWWAHLQEADRGGRAALRRSRSIDTVYFEPAFHRLLLALRNGGYALGDWHERRVALCAAVVAIVEEPDGPKFAQALAKPAGEGDRPALSGLRVRQLLAEDFGDGLLTRMSRAVKQVGSRVDLVDLAQSVLDWGANRPQFDSRYRIASTYYAKRPDQP